MGCGSWALEFMAPRASKECAEDSGYGHRYLRAPPSLPPRITYRVGKDFPLGSGPRPVASSPSTFQDRRCFLAATSHVRGPDLSSLASAALRQARQFKFVRVLNLPEWLLAPAHVRRSGKAPSRRALDYVSPSRQRSIFRFDPPRLGVKGVASIVARGLSQHFQRDGAG